MRIRRVGITVGAIAPFSLMFIVALLWVMGLMFEYWFFTVTGKDVHFMLDILGAIVLNVINFPMFVFPLIYRACGYPVPIFN